jgi:hypothetical protein
MQFPPVPVTSPPFNPYISLNTPSSQPLLLPPCDRPRFTPTQSNRQNYSTVYFKLYPFPRTVALHYTVLPFTVHPESTSRHLQKFQPAGNVMWLPAEIKEMEGTIRPSCLAQCRFKRFHRMLIVSVKQLSHTPRNACATKWLQHGPRLCRGEPVRQNGSKMSLDLEQERLCCKVVATCPSTIYRNDLQKGLSVETVDKGGIYHGLYLHFQKVCHVL